MRKEFTNEDPQDYVGGGHSCCWNHGGERPGHDQTNGRTGGQPKQDIGEIVGDLVVSGATLLAHSAAETVVKRVKKAAAKLAPVEAVNKVVKKAKKSAAGAKVAKAKKAKKASKKSGPKKSTGKKAAKKSSKKTTRKKTRKKSKR